MRAFLLAVLAVGAAGQARAEDRKAGQLPEMTIRAEQKGKLKSERPPLALPLDEEQEVRPSLAVSTAALAQEPLPWKDRKPFLPKVLRSPLALAPHTTRIAREPVAVFHPLKELDAAGLGRGATEGRWQYVVTDAAGQTHRTWAGTGHPPEAIPFDGRSDQGRMLQPGLAYTPVLLYADAKGTHTIVGQPLLVQGIQHQEPEALYLRLDPRALWEAPLDQIGEVPPEISPAGRELLQEAADWIKRRYHPYPLELRVRLPSPEGAAAATRLVRERLAELLRRDPQDLPASGSGAPAAEARIEIVVKNR